MAKYLVSACLAGVRCRYDGESKTDPRIVELVRRGDALPICPEQLGGLPTPREPAQIVSFEPLHVETRSGQDVTEQFRRGAEETLRIAHIAGAREAIIKERSPSCGVCCVYVRTAEGEQLVPGEGVTTALLRREGITVYSEESWQDEG